MRTMEDHENSKEVARQQFAKRLNELLDYYKVPAKQSGRQQAVKAVLGVSQEAVRKWAEGEAIPRHERIITICEVYPCRTAWLEYGELPMMEDRETMELLKLWDELSDAKRKALLETLRP